MNRKIFIRRTDLEGMFEYAPPYQVTCKSVKTEKIKQTFKPSIEPETETASNSETFAESILHT